jgi:hypothetical protein
MPVNNRTAASAGESKSKEQGDGDGRSEKPLQINSSGKRRTHKKQRLKRRMKRKNSVTHGPVIPFQKIATSPG